MGDFTREVAVRPFCNHKILHSILVMPVALIVLSLAGCEGEETTRPTAEEGSYRVSRLVAEVTTLRLGDSTIVRAYVVGADGTTPAADREVQFGEMLSKRSGTYAKSSSKSDPTGVASTVYRADAGVTGEATLKATAGGYSAYASVYLVAAQSSELILEITSPTGATAIPADGSTRLPLRVTAASGVERQPVGGLEITLTAGDQFVDTDGNGLFSDGDILYPGGDANGNGSWDALGVVPATVRTNGSGVADFELRSETVTGISWVRATADGVGADLAVTFHPTSLQVLVQTGVREMLADGVSTTWVTAQVGDWGGGPTAGVIVRFTAGEPFVDIAGDGEFTPGTDSFDDTNENGQWDVIGQIDSYGTTGEDGDVRVTYTAGLIPGPVRVRATVSGGSAEGTVQLVPVPSAARLEIVADRSSVYGDGRSRIDGELTAWDVNGTRLAGKQARLAAGEPFEDLDHDGLFTPGTDQLLADLDGNGEWTAIGEVDPVCVTGAGGVGFFTYRAGTVVGGIVVKATVDGVGVDLPIRLLPLPPVTTITLTRSTDEILVRDGGGTDNVLLIATCYDALGDTVPAGISVEFSILSGPGGGEDLVDGAGGVYLTRTEPNGQARAVLVSGTLTGVAVVEVIVGTVHRTIEVGIAAGHPNRIVVHADDDILTFWAQTNVCAHVMDLYGNPVRNGTIVVFSVDEGMIEGSDGLASSQVSHGRACSVYYSLGPSIGTDYVASIIARAQGTTTVGNLEIQLEETPPPPINEIEITADRDRVRVRSTGPTDVVHLVARGFTVDGQPVGAGYPIDFWIESGPQGGENLNGETSATVPALTNQDGIAQVTLEPGTLPGPVQVRCHSGTANIVGVEVQIIAGPPVALDCSAVPDEIGSEETCEIRAYLYDEYHNPVQDGVLVSFQVDEGMVVGMDGPGSSRTVNGRAIATYHSLTPDPNGDGVATITCTAEGGVLGCQTNVRIPIQSTGLETLSLTATEDEMMVTGAAGAEQATLQVIAYDPSGQVVGEGFTIRFEIRGGPGGGESLNGVVGGPTTQSTNAQGRASVTLATGTNAGQVRIAARYGQIWSNELSIPIRPGPAAEIACWPGRAQVGADDSTTVFVRVRDLHRNPVTDSTVVTLSVDEGWVNGTAYPGASYSWTIGGYATGLYHTPEEIPGGDGWADVACSVQDGPVCRTRVAIPSSASEPVSMRIYAVDSEIGVSGTGAVDQTTIVATPMNAQEGVIGSGVEVLFEILSGPTGVLIGGDPDSVTILTRNDGTARVTLTAGTASGIVDVRATAGLRASNHAGVTVTAGAPAHIECTAPDSAACNSQLTSGEVRAYVTDIHHNPVRDGTPVWFTADAGLIVGNMGLGAATETAFGIGYAWYFAPLASECETWTIATLSFHAGNLVCTRSVYKATGP